MGMYAIAITPLMTKLKEKCPNIRQAWYADDATGASTCGDLRRWWDELTKLGSLFGYHPHPSKTHLVVKENTKRALPKPSWIQELISLLKVNATLERQLGHRASPRSLSAEKSMNGLRKFGSLPM